MTDGGKGDKRACGCRWTPEQRARMGAARKGKPFSEKHRANLSLSHTGKKLSAEAKAKLAAHFKGRKKPPRTEAHRAALAEAAHRFYERKRCDG